MKQMELNFSKILEVEEPNGETQTSDSTTRLEEQSESEDSPANLTPKYVKKTCRITKKEGKLLASKNKSMMSWVSMKKVTVIEGEPSTRLQEEVSSMDWQENEVDGQEGKTCGSKN